ncbi:MAG: polyprenol monophosphomannose synthase, partial [Saprospiraceae bacterium]|nr:polyprenol monophosphomannose synthase [Saprospiraceae bacterium]
MAEKLVIIPTYKEKENISNIIHAVLEQDGQNFHLLIIDDNSPDGTADIVKDLMQNKFPGRLFIVEREGKLGLGTAYICGFKWALERDYEYIFEMDADFSHNPKDLPRLYEACKKDKVGVAIGSRYIRGGKLENWPMNRILMSRGASIYVRIATWMPVADSTAGFVCYKRSFLEQLDFEKIKFSGYAFQIEMKFAAWQLGYKLSEIPITFIDRVLGTSKMSTKIFMEAFFGVLKIRWKGFFDTYKRSNANTLS